MGIFGSSEENVEQKIVDSNGQVNNNIVIQEARLFVHQLQEEDEENVSTKQRQLNTVYQNLFIPLLMFFCILIIFVI